MSEPAKLQAGDVSSTPTHSPAANLELVPSVPSSGPREPEQLVLRMLEVVKDGVDRLHSHQRLMAEELKNIRTGLPMQRRPLSKRTQAIHLQGTLSRRNGICPCCSIEPVCSEEGRLVGAEFDHFFARDKNKIQEVWLVCRACNQNLTDTDFKASARSAFEAYQRAIKPLLASRQVTMELSEGEKGK